MHPEKIFPGTYYDDYAAVTFKGVSGQTKYGLPSPEGMDWSQVDKFGVPVKLPALSKAAFLRSRSLDAYRMKTRNLSGCATALKSSSSLGGLIDQLGQKFNHPAGVLRDNTGYCYGWQDIYHLIDMDRKDCECPTCDYLINVWTKEGKKKELDAILRKTSRFTSVPTWEWSGLKSGESRACWGLKLGSEGAFTRDT
jgi:hypothetical protein